MVEIFHFNQQLPAFDNFVHGLGGMQQVDKVSRVEIALNK